MRSRSVNREHESKDHAHLGGSREFCATQEASTGESLGRDASAVITSGQVETLGMSGKEYTTIAEFPHDGVLEKRIHIYKLNH